MMQNDSFDVKSLCETAVATGKEVAGVELDGSVESLEVLEIIIQKLYLMNRKGLLNDTVCWNISACLGAYLGEVMLRDQLEARGFSWQMNTDGLPVVRNTETQNAISPISKIYKMLNADGEGTPDDFYRVFLLMLESDS